MQGVSDAERAIRDQGGTVNPVNVGFTKDGAYNSYSHAMPQEVLFDVALTATEKQGATEGIGVFLGGISLGRKTDAGTEQVAITKVRFTVPLVLPPGKSLRT